MTKSMTKSMTEGQRAYEQRRAAKAGMSLENWVDSKTRAREQAQLAADMARDPRPPELAKMPGLLARLIDRAHQPLRRKKEA